jgi:formylglycine-generating enzyme required for sulfatase activity
MMRGPGRRTVWTGSPALGLLLAAACGSGFVPFVPQDEWGSPDVPESADIAEGTGPTLDTPDFQADPGIPDADAGELPDDAAPPDDTTDDADATPQPLCAGLAACGPRCASLLACDPQCLVTIPPDCAACTLDGVARCAREHCGEDGADPCLATCARAPNPFLCLSMQCPAGLAALECVSLQRHRGRCVAEFAACGLPARDPSCGTCLDRHRACRDDGTCGSCLPGWSGQGAEECSPLASCGEACDKDEDCVQIDGLPRCGCRAGRAVESGARCTDAQITNAFRIVVAPGSTGTFRQGSDHGPSSLGPCHPVTLTRPYAIQQYEVTTAEYARCVSAQACPPLLHCIDNIDLDPMGPRRGGNHPILCVGARAAQSYCRWIGSRLPTESEWEYAATGPVECPKGAWYPWGTGFIDGNVANYAESFNPFQATTGAAVDAAGGPTTPVGFFDGSVRARAASGWIGGPDTFHTADDASPFGVRDLAGNAAEWVADCYHDSYFGAPTDGTAWTDGSGPCSRQVKKGEAWSDVAASLTTFYRAPKSPDLAASYMGFRCAADLSE